MVARLVGRGSETRDLTRGDTHGIDRGVVGKQVHMFTAKVWTNVFRLSAATHGRRVVFSVCEGRRQSIFSVL